MRVGLLIYGSLETLSGGYLYDHRLVERLLRQGDTVEIVSLPWRNYAAHLGDNLSAALQTRLERLNCDLLLQDELNHPSLFLLNQRLRRRPARPPVYAIVHHLRVSEQRPAWHNRLLGLVERRYLQSVDGFIFNSEVTRQSVYMLAPETDHRPYVIARPAGDRFAVYGAPLDVARVRARAVDPGPLRVVFVGNLIARKGLHTLLDALARLPRAAWTLQVVGDPHMDSTYARLVRDQSRQLGLDDHIEWCGRLDQAPLAEILRQAHVLAVPSSYEGFGIVYLEGMSFGLPAIAGTGGGASEIVEHAHNGYLVMPGDACTLAQDLARLAADRDLLAEISQAALETFLSHPTWDDCTGRIRDFLAAQLEGKP
jgi:glycosyltransferase involved in cell wall biosynthesis